MNIRFVSGLALFFVMLSGCSWQEYFVIMNNSPSPVTIEYCVTMSFEGFPIFADDPEVFECYRNNTINWERPIQQEVTTTSDTVFRFTLNPGNASIIGRLSNDHYSHYNQYYINGRVFNLEYIYIYSDKDTTTIYPENFDKVFKKEDGYISCRLS